MNCKQICNRFALLNRIAVSNKSFATYKSVLRTTFALRNVQRQIVTASNSLLNVSCSEFNQQRFKSKKKGKQAKEEQVEEDEEAEERDAEETESLPEVMKLDVPSLKIEFVLARSMFKSKVLFEEALAKRRIRVNGEPCETRDMEVGIGDVFDYILGRSPQDYELLNVNRVTIMKLPDKLIKGRYHVEIERTMRLTIHNYKNNPWDGISITE